jgi:nucleoside-diphosphate-sugar epimerase
MANVIGKDIAKKKIYNVQDAQSVTFEGLAKLTAEAMGKDYKGPSPLSDFSVKKFNPKDFKFPEGKKAFPMRPGHFFCGIDNACRDLDWSPKYDLAEGLKDSYEHDYKLRANKDADFTCDDIILNDDRISAKLYDGNAVDKV